MMKTYITIATFHIAIRLCSYCYMSRVIGQHNIQVEILFTQKKISLALFSHSWTTPQSIGCEMAFLIFSIVTHFDANTVTSLPSLLVKVCLSSHNQGTAQVWKCAGSFLRTLTTGTGVSWTNWTTCGPFWSSAPWPDFSCWITYIDPQGNTKTHIANMGPRKGQEHKKGRIVGRMQSGPNIGLRAFGAQGRCVTSRF